MSVMGGDSLLLLCNIMQHYEKEPIL